MDSLGILYYVDVWGINIKEARGPDAEMLRFRAEHSSALPASSCQLASAVDFCLDIAEEEGGK
jgi:hypothetical protein